jgi:uncharacterized protein (TIGR03067 family)
MMFAGGRAKGSFPGILTMNVFRIGAALLWGALVLTSPPAGADDAQDIVGVWEPIAAETEGNEVPPEAVKQLVVLLTFKITKDKITTPPDDDETEISYSLTPASNPKGIDTVDLNGDAKGTRNKGIYELNGDVFRLCMGPKNGPRPQRFTTKPGDEGGELLVKFQRKR